MILTSLPLALVLALGARAAGENPVLALPAPAEAENLNVVPGSFLVERGAQVSLWIPPGEFLEFEVQVNLGLLGEVSVGGVDMSSGLELFVSGLPRPGQPLAADPPLTAWVRVAAHGSHLGYELEHSITTRFLPQPWPSLIHSEVQSGTEHRQREIEIGQQAGQWKSAFRANGHCVHCTRREHYIEATLPWNADYHCKKCKRAEHRLWGQRRLREVPEQSVDLLAAVYLARSLVRGDREQIELSLVQKDHLWNVSLQRAALREIEVAAGTFLCREVRLSVARPVSEPDHDSKFSGLFGIKGALKIWLQEGSGVPVSIEGDVPLGGLLDLHVKIELAKFRGTPEAFKSLRGDRQ